MRTALAVVVVLAAAPARADPWRWEGDVGLRFGSIDFDGRGAFVFGLQGLAGVGYGRFAVLAEFADGGTSAPDPVPTLAMSDTTDGNWKRFGGRVRYSLLRHRDTPRGDPEAELWIEGGVGRQHVTWDVGGVLDRNDVMVGVGGTLGDHGPRHHGGITFDLVALYTRSHDQDGPTCGGPCDMPTLPPRIMRSLMFDIGIAFGTNGGQGGHQTGQPENQR